MNKPKTITVPGSKSLTNRALILASLTNGVSILKQCLFSDDTQVTINALKSLGIKIIKKGTNLKVYGQEGKFKPTKKTLNLGNAGTAVRFLTAILTLSNTPCRITGIKRMQERPIQDLINSLKLLGANIESEKKNNCPPLIIKTGNLTNSNTNIKGDTSSQYLSALLIACPLLEKKIDIKIIGNLCSKPYIDLTIDYLKKFGVQVKKTKTGYQTKPSIYQKINLEIEADASSATYFYAIAALNPNSPINIKNANPKSLQGDTQFLEIIKKMGCQVDLSTKGITVKGPQLLKPLSKINLNSLPDAAMTVAILCAFAKGKSHLTGLSNLKVKETDRLSALKIELTKIGCQVKKTKDGLIINGNPETLIASNIKTYNDHRMAMCFAVAKTKIPQIKILNPKCVSKTYPTFWIDYKKIIKK